jgi:GH15 family glucan-1,4-alpha-glucosidase
VSVSIRRRIRHKHPKVLIKRTADYWNLWFISTLWLADYFLEKADREKGLPDALELLNWVADHALASGVLPEQLHPHTGEPLSVSPLNWSHAAFLTTTQRYLRAKEGKGVGSSDGHARGLDFQALR